MNQLAISAANQIRSVITHPKVVAIANSTAGKITRYLANSSFFKNNLELCTCFLFMQQIVSTLRPVQTKALTRIILTPSKGSKKPKKASRTWTILKFAGIGVAYGILSRSALKVMFASWPIILQNFIRLAGTSFQIVMIYKIAINLLHSSKPSRPTSRKPIERKGSPSKGRGQPRTPERLDFKQKAREDVRLPTPPVDSSDEEPGTNHVVTEQPLGRSQPSSRLHPPLRSRERVSSFSSPHTSLQALPGLCDQIVQALSTTPAREEVSPQIIRATKLLTEYVQALNVVQKSAQYHCTDPEKTIGKVVALAEERIREATQAAEDWAMHLKPPSDSSTIPLEQQTRLELGEVKLFQETKNQVRLILEELDVDYRPILESIKLVPPPIESVHVQPTRQPETLENKEQ